MAEQTSQEPTMEEILASIRRIISEDEAPASDVKEAAPAGDEGPAAEEAPAATAPEPEPAPAPEPAQPAPQPVSAAPPPAQAEPEADEDDEPLELTEKVETVGDLDVYTPSEPPPSSRPVVEPPATPPGEMLVSARAAEAAASAFGKLSQVVAMPAEGRTLEDVVRELLRPLLQQWLDDHLPAIVQEAVQAEVERIARTRVR